MGYMDKMFGNQKQNDRARYDELLGKGHRGSEALHIIERERREQKERERASPRERKWRESYPRPPPQRKEKKSGGGVLGALTGGMAQNFYRNMGGYGSGGFGFNPADVFGGGSPKQAPKKRHKKHKGNRKGKSGKTIVIHL